MNPPRRVPRTRVVDHTIYGVYVWQLPTGQYFANDNQDILSIASVKGDIGKMAKLQRAAAYWGQPNGSPVFMAGNRKITQEEFDHQWERQLNGELADEYDVGAILDELRGQKLHGSN
jgi:hypothetical protein